ncbi:hypothetical protein GRI39_04440 [Altererythrobacter indicus]|uniref:Uncharacterized protein n=1 Tax=Altericroceibacterium indicum TaxID=374177 RepID=A0A845A7R2_9SPHN|nr:hypothetical protein [Altericroceibacterium indicum]MXP25293.1 hypothetical protein [Altericroceibacterium indicum]
MTIDDPLLFSDRIVAHSRGMLSNIAYQLVTYLEDNSNNNNKISVFSDKVDELYNSLLSDQEVLDFVHAEALEWQLADRLETQLGLDPVTPPILQELVRSDQVELAQLAKDVQAVQANAAQMARRMEMPLKALPADIFHKVLLIFEKGYIETQQAHTVAQLCVSLRETYAERKRRINKIARMLLLMGRRLREALFIEKAGVAIFSTALAAASGEERRRLIYTLSESQASRLGLTMRAAGLSEEEINEQIALLHPGLSVDIPFDRIAYSNARNSVERGSCVSEAE